MNQNVQLGQGQPVSSAAFRGFQDAQAFIQNSVTLRDKRVIGQFLSIPTDDVMMAKSHFGETLRVPIDKVVTIVSGWIVGD